MCHAGQDDQRSSAREELPKNALQSTKCHYLCCPFHDCFPLFARDIVCNFSSVLPVTAHQACQAHVGPHCQMQSSLQHTAYLLCINRSSSSLMFDTTNLKKPANGKWCQDHGACGHCVCKTVQQLRLTVGKHVPVLLVGTITDVCHNNSTSLELSPHT